MPVRLSAQAGPRPANGTGPPPADGADPRPRTADRVRLRYGGQDYDLAPGESVLDGLARHGVRVPSACRAGACHACLLKADTGDPGPAGQHGLKPALAARGYFLACLARPATGLAVRSGPEVITPGTLAASRWLGPDVLAIWLRPGKPVAFRAGQHATLHRGDGVIRTYSIANLPAEAARDGLEFHVRVYPGGAMSTWLARAAPGTRVGIGIPAGECFYTPGSPAAALLLAGTGTGIAPLLAIARDAFAQGHTGPVAVLHGAAEPGRLYLGTPLPRCVKHEALAAIRWRTCALSRGQDIVAAVTAELAAGPGPAATRAFLCGGPRTVAAMRRALFLAGMSLRDICADQFVPTCAGP
jgi:CDP-4-dehydro-6-deoxyglucose reductase, E3